MTVYYEIAKKIENKTINQVSAINAIISNTYLYRNILENTLDTKTLIQYSDYINNLCSQVNSVYIVLPSNCENESRNQLLGLLNHRNIEIVLYEWEPTYNLYLEVIKKYNNKNITWLCSNSIFKLDIESVQNLYSKENNSIISVSSQSKHLLVLFNIDNFTERLLQLLTLSTYTNIEEINYILYLSGFQFFYSDDIKPTFLLADNSLDSISSNLSSKIRFVHNDVVSTKFNDIQKNNLLEAANNSLYSYIKQKLDNDEHFIIPRISLSIQPQCILLAHNLLEAYKSKDTSSLEQYSEQIQHYIPTLKVNSGIYCTDIDSLLQYYSSYMSSMELAEYIIEPEVNINSDIYRAIYESIDFIKKENSNKQFNFFYCLEIYNLIYKQNLWSNLFNGKKILIVSTQTDLIEKQMAKTIYKKPLFDNSNCSFLTIKDTRENMESNDWMIEYKSICDKLGDISDNYDIALVAANGFSNPLLEYIYSTGKSGLYIGNMLDVYFGITDKNDNAKYMDIMSVYGSNEWIEY